MFDVKPIETQYKGYRFRSRLEARWAVFFDALGIEWQYELEGYDLGDAGRYLPDFWLPQVSMFAEVKPERFTKKEESKCLALAKATQKDVLMLDGLPRIKYYDAVIDGGIEREVVFVSNYHNYHVDEHRFYTFPGGENPEDDGLWSNEDSYAVNRAKSARFEFGEEG